MNKTISSTRRFSDIYNSKCMSLLNREQSFTDTINTRPPVNMIQRDGKFLISVELPGVRQEDISLETSGRSLHIKAKYREQKKRPGDSMIIEERKRTDVYRFIYMPHTADLEKLDTARYKDGVLHVQIPEMSRGCICRTIPVKSDE